MAIEVDDKLVAVREAAAECGRNMETVRRWIWSGKLPAQKLGNQLFIKRTDLRSFYRNHKVATQKPSDWTKLMKEVKTLREEIRRKHGNFDITELIEESRKDLL
ncbi:MAG: helix-turn-helix domain-containing protein [Dehalococcoidia bacterium]|nr:helix-turn-helix domain-containing protein [Dehalococcoidia bacterium]